MIAFGKKKLFISRNQEFITKYELLILYELSKLQNNYFDSSFSFLHTEIQIETI